MEKNERLYLSVLGRQQQCLNQPQSCVSFKNIINMVCKSPANSKSLSWILTPLISMWGDELNRGALCKTTCFKNYLWRQQFPTCFDMARYKTYKTDKNSVSQGLTLPVNPLLSGSQSLPRLCQCILLKDYDLDLTLHVSLETWHRTWGKTWDL